MTYLKYILGGIASLPLLPILYWHGKGVRRKVPRLPEATGTSGTTDNMNIRAINLLALGESTIAGVGIKDQKDGLTAALANSLSEQLECTVNWNIIAKSGATLKEINQNLLPTNTHQADIIIVGTGGNDAFTLNTPWRWRHQILLFLEQLRKEHPDCPIVFCSMPPVKEFPAFPWSMKLIIGNLVQTLGKTLEKTVASIPNCYFHKQDISLNEWGELLGLDNVNSSDFFSDGVHPSAKSYQAWGRSMGSYIVIEEILTPARA